MLSPVIHSGFLPAHGRYEWKAEPNLCRAFYKMGGILWDHTLGSWVSYQKGPWRSWGATLTGHAQISTIPSVCAAHWKYCWVLTLCMTEGVAVLRSKTESAVTIVTKGDNLSGSRFSVRREKWAWRGGGGAAMRSFSHQSPIKVWMRGVALFVKKSRPLNPCFKNVTKANRFDHHEGCRFFSRAHIP